MPGFNVSNHVSSPAILKVIKLTIIFLERFDALPNFCKWNTTNSLGNLHYRPSIELN